MRAVQSEAAASRPSGRDDAPAAVGTPAEALYCALLRASSIAQLEKLNIPHTDDREKFHAHRQVRAQVKAIWNGANFDEHARLGTSKVGQPVAIILDRTSFYAEMGGQEADRGRLNVTRESRTGHSLHEGTGGEFRVEDVRAFGGYVLHIGHVTRGELRVGDDILTHVVNHGSHHRGQVTAALTAIRATTPIST